MAQGSASKVQRVRRCLHRYYYSDLLELQRVAKSIAPARGTIIHECLRQHYSGKDWTIPIQGLAVDWENLFDEERAEWGELPKELYRIIRGYLLAYKNIDSKLKTIATEVQFSMKIQGARGEHDYIGFIDWIYEDENGLVWIADHKTVKSLPSEQELYMDMQTLMYYEACRLDPNLVALLQGRKLGGVVFNHLRTKAPKEPQLLKSGGVSRAACDTDVATYFETIRKNGLDVNDYRDMVDKLKGNVFFRRTKIPVSEKTINILKREIAYSLDQVDYFCECHAAEEDMSDLPRTMMKSRCVWDCEFAPLCFAELAGMNTSGLIAEMYETRAKRITETEVE